MVITNIVKVTEGDNAYKAYKVSSLPCPKCGKVLVLEVASQKVFYYHQGAGIEEVLEGFTPMEREAFVTGYCKEDWEALFGPDDEDDEGDDD
jgi:hypothetical protein